MNNCNCYLLVADKRINEFMRGADLREEGKWYICTQELSFKTEKELNESYFLDLIEKSYNDFLVSSDKLSYWIPGIIYGNNVISHQSVRHLTTGNSTIFIPKKKDY